MQITDLLSLVDALSGLVLSAFSRAPCTKLPLVAVFDHNAPMGQDVPDITEIDDDRSLPDTRIADGFHRLQPGTELAGYRIESVLGVGGMGEVYRATQLRMDRIVALKVLPPRFAADQVFRQRFVREAQQAGKLSHPHFDHGVRCDSARWYPCLCDGVG